MLWLVVAVVVICGLAVFTFLYWQSRTKAKLERERLRQLHVRPLEPPARERYVEAWQALQSRFGDEPEVSIRDADHLIQNVMRDRGYPTGDFGRLTEILSAGEAEVIDNYRLAHRISAKCETSSLSTEEIQRAVTALRALFDSLVAP